MPDPNPASAAPEPSYALAPDQGTRWLWLGGAIRFLARTEDTGDRYTAETSSPKGGSGPARHVQSREDECFYLCDGGRITFTAGNQTLSLGAGSFISIAAGTAHRFDVEDDVGRLFLFNAPAGFDRFQREVGSPFNGPGAPPGSKEEWAARIEEAAPRHGITMNPDAALFERAPTIRVVEAGSAPDHAAGGVAVRILAGPGHTSGRYAMVEATLAEGAQCALGHPEAVTGLYVVDGRLALDGTEPMTLEPASFLHLAPGDRRTATGRAVGTRILLCHAPGLGVPLR